MDELQVEIVEGFGRFFWLNIDFGNLFNSDDAIFLFFLFFFSSELPSKLNANYC